MKLIYNIILKHYKFNMESNKVKTNNIILLLKKDLNSYFSFFNKFKNKHISFLSIIALGYILILLLILLYLIGFCRMFDEVSSAMTVVNMGISISSLLIFFTNISKINAYLFNNRDNDFILCLPVTRKEIIISKLIFIYFTSYLLSFTIIIPAYLAYAFVINFNIFIFLKIIIITIFIPIIPILISSLLATFLNKVILNKTLKKIIYIGFYLIIGIGIILSYINILGNGRNDLYEQVGILNKYILNIYPLTKFISIIIFNDNQLSFLYLFIFVIISLHIFNLSILVITNKYIYLNEKSEEVTKEKKIKFKKKPKEIALFIKEFRMYKSIPDLIVNTIIGPILSIITVSFICLFLVKNNFNTGIETLDNYLIELNKKEFYVGIIIFMVSLIIHTTNISSSSISLEGNTFWVLKSMPINDKDIYLSKLLFNYIINIIYLIICNIIMIVLFNLNIKYIIISFVLNVVIELLFSILGLVINLYFPKLNYLNKMQVIKQSIAVLINMLIAFILNIIYLFIYIFIAMNINIIFSLIIMLCIFILSIIILIIIFKRANNRFNKIIYKNGY